MGSEKENKMVDIFEEGPIGLFHVICVIASFFLAFWLAGYAVVIHHYGIEGLMDGIHMVEVPKKGPMIVSNGDQLDDGISRFIFLPSLFVLWLSLSAVSYFGWSRVYRKWYPKDSVGKGASNSLRQPQIDADERR